MQNKYTIEARSYALCNVASHNFWVLRNGTEQVVSQLHGLATSRRTNQFKPIGYFNDRLGFYEFKTAENDPNFISITQQAIIVYQGSKKEVLSCWTKASYQINKLNKLDINYSPFGILGFPITNSNSAYHLYAQLMQIECCYFPWILQPGINNRLKYCQ